MARLELDREDLIRDGTAYVERIELEISAESDPVIVGFRKTGCVSFYFGPAPVYQFNSSCQLRRANDSGMLWKAEDGHLVTMRRNRADAEVQLLRRKPSADEASKFQKHMKERLDRLATAISSNQATTRRQVPEHAKILDRVRTWLAENREWPIAESPNAR